MVNPLVLPSPAVVGDEWGNSLNVAVQSVNADVEALKVRSISAGLGLTGGGDLTQNRSFAVDFAASGVSSATKAVRADDKRLNATFLAGDTQGPTARPETYPVGLSIMEASAAGWPLQFGTLVTKFLTVNRAAQEYTSKTGRVWVRAADSSLTDGWTPWVEKSLVGHTHVKANITDFAHTHAIADVTSLQTTLDAKALATRLITAGSGLTGGGNLTADRTLAVDLATATPLADATTGAGAVGTAVKSAREDHVHPSLRSDVALTLDANVSSSGPGHRAYRRGDMVTVYAEVVNNIGWNTTWGLAVVPVGYRPVRDVTMVGSNASTGNPLILKIDMSGNITTPHVNLATGTTSRFTVAYPVA